MEKMVATVLYEGHERPVEETMDALGEVPGDLCRSCID